MNKARRWAVGGILLCVVAVGLAIYLWGPWSRTRPSQPDDAKKADNKTPRPAGEGVVISQRLFRVDLTPGQVGSVRIPITNKTSHPVRVTSVQTDCRCVRSDKPIGPIPPNQTTDLELVAVGSMPGSRTVMIATDVGRLLATVQVVVAGRGKGVDIAKQALSRLDGTTGVHLLAVMHDLKGQVSRTAGTTLGGLGRLPALKRVLPSDKTTWLASGDWLGMAERSEVLPALEKYGIAVLMTGQERMINIGAAQPVSAVASTQPAESLKSYDLIITRASNPPRNVRIIEPQLGEGLGIDLYVLDKRGWPIATFMVPLDESFTEGAAGATGSRPDAP